MSRFSLGRFRQVAEVRVRIAVMNGYTALGIPVTKAMA
jgi:hypothetical protein